MEELVKGVISTPGGKQRQGNHPPINTGRAGLPSLSPTAEAGCLKAGEAVRRGAPVPG